jgi:hypothetical protein
MSSQPLDLVQTLQHELTCEKLEEIITTLTEPDKLKEFLKLLDHKIPILEEYNPYNHGKIAVLGGSIANKQHLQGISKQLGFNKNRFEYFLSYDEMKTFRFNKLRNINKYAAIIAGPMPHSTSGTGTYSSAIAAMENDDDYPPVFRIEKITNSSFRNIVKYMMDQNVVAV